MLDIWSRTRPTLTRAQLHALEPVINEELLAHPYYTGCGFVADLDLVDGATRYWEWLTPGPGAESPPQPLKLHTGVEGDELYAYEQMEWFQRAREGESAVVGPYMDFAGADRLVLTFAQPVVDGQTFLGVTGADIPLSGIESRLLRLMKGSSTPMAVVNRAGRVIVSTSADAAPMERLQREAREELPVGSASVGWRLCVLG